ncbi:MAG: GGDEF domain-containing phosphodiesterase [Bacillota bacterium]
MNSIQELTILKNFSTTKDMSLALMQFLREMGELYDFAVATIFFKNEACTKFIKCFEHEKDMPTKDYLLERDLNTNIYFKRDLMPAKNIEDLIDAFDISCYIYSETFSELAKVFYEAQYTPKNQDDLTEFYSFLMQDSFGYFVFERHDSAKKLTPEEISSITLLCEIINEKINDFVQIKRDNSEIKIKDYILGNENFSVFILQKDSYEVLYHNEQCKDLFPTMRIGSSCYDVKEHIVTCETPDGESTQLTQFKLPTKQSCVVRTLPLSYSNDIDAYIIYAKDATDYLKEYNLIDLLTGAPTFVKLQRFFIETVQNSKESYALCVMDIDKFEYLNYRFGYRFGDKILKAISEVLFDFQADQEAFCRLSDDKFAICVKYTTVQELKERFSNLTTALNKMQQQTFANKKITVIGGICFTSKNASIHTLIDQASTARKSIKGLHETRFRLYDSQLHTHLLKENRIEERMLIGIKNNEFEPYLQAKFNLHTMELCGAEALVRWNAPCGMIYPNEFIPVFEKNGFISILDFMVYKLVLKYIRNAMDRGLPICPISLNVSRGHIDDPLFIEKFLDLLELYQVPIDMIELEVTESAFIEDRTRLTAFINDLKLHNIHVSIDDFGTAYSSLNLLKDVEVDVLKIDREFLQDIDVVKLTEIPSKDKIVIKHIIEMAKALNFSIVCEGIETEVQIEFLKEIGCSIGQGYYFAKPMPISEFEERFYPDFI